MDKKVAMGLLVVAGALYGTALHAADHASGPGPTRRGPADASVSLDCEFSAETLAAPERQRVVLEPGCLEGYLQRLERALSESAAVRTFSIRSGRIDDIPPSSQWTVGLDPRFPEAPSYRIAVPFEEPLSWEPYVATWFPVLEVTPPQGAASGLSIWKRNLTPQGIELQLTATNRSEILEITVAWVAYDTTVGSP